jgi:hypothetical protein
MSFSPSFQVGQNPLYPSTIVAVDTSSGSDVLITSRRIYVQNSLGNYLVPNGTTTDYTVWNIGDSEISLDILTEDTACEIRVDWLASDNSVLYTSSDTFCFADYNKQFAYSLCQGLTPPITLDTNYSNNLAALWTSIKGAENAVTGNNDIAASQNILNQGTYLRLNANLFF